MRLNTKLIDFSCGNKQVERTSFFVACNNTRKSESDITNNICNNVSNLSVYKALTLFTHHGIQVRHLNCNRASIDI